MKLIRLTSEDPTALFDCDFNGGITIPENSKIALQSVSANLQAGVFLVDTVNNKIIYQIATNYIREVELTPFLYFEGNTDELFKDIENKFNDKVSFVSGIGVNKVLGLEWKAGIKSGGRTQIEYDIGRAESWSGLGSSSVPNLWEENNTEYTLGGSNRVFLGAEATQTPTDTFTNMCILPHACSKGCGYVRARLSVLTNTGATNTNGYIIAFSKTSPDPTDFQERDIFIGIRVGFDNTTGVRYYALILNGVEQTRSTTVPFIDGSGSIKNDSIELMITGSRVEANIYHNNPLPTTKINLGFSAYNNEDLFPCYIFKGDRTHAQLNQTRFTASPFFQSAINLTQPPTSADEENDPASVNAPPQPPSVIPTSNNKLTFGSNELADYLGYASPIIPAFGTQVADVASFNAINEFSVGLGIQGFIIQLLNVNVESYDSLRKQRENILAVIPSTDGSGDLNYSPPFMIPIDLNNIKPLSLRNIKARIVRTDYSNFIMEGTGLINLVVV